MPRLLDNWIYQYLDWTVNRSEAQESMIIWSGLFTLASVLKRHVYFPRSLMGSYDIYPNLYVIFIGPSSIIRKSTTIGYGETLLYQLEKINMAPSGTSASMLIGKMAETIDGSMTIVSSEFGTFIQTSKEDMYDILSDLYDGKVKHDYETRQHGAEFIKSPCLNLFAATTNKWLQEQPTYVIGGGFSARTIYVHETTVRRRKLYYHLRWDDYKRLEESLVHDLAHISELKGVFHHDCKETEDAMEEWYQKTSDKDVSENVVAFRNRKHVHIHKVAMLFSLAESDELTINMSHFEAALTLLNAIEAKLPGVFAAIGKNPFGSDMEAIKEYLSKMDGPVEFNRVHRRFYQDIPGSEKLKELLGEMVALGWIKKNRNEDKNKTYYTYVGG